MPELGIHALINYIVSFANENVKLMRLAQKSYDLHHVPFGLEQVVRRSK